MNAADSLRAERVRLAIMAKAVLAFEPKLTEIDPHTHYYNGEYVEMLEEVLRFVAEAS